MDMREFFKIRVCVTPKRNLQPSFLLRAQESHLIPFMNVKLRTVFPRVNCEHDVRNTKGEAIIFTDYLRNARLDKVYVIQSVNLRWMRSRFLSECARF